MKPAHIALLALSLTTITVFWHYTASNTHHEHPKKPPTYHELYRPGYHFTPPQDWMNDPNGLTFVDGKYHMFYQFNPFNTIWGNMSWGHATSTDLVYWENLPVAIPFYDGIGIFSGCNVIDVNNTSGLCEEKGCLLAFYTAKSPDNSENQAIAISNDNGTSYTQYSGNPIIDLNTSNNRDPKVFWYEPDQKWVLIDALPMSYELLLYSSTDLIHWTQMSMFGPDGSEAGGWEDPDLFPLTVEGETTVKWVLYHSVAVNAVEYYIGDFNGTHFVDTDTVNETLYIDYGFDFDEAATWNNEPNGRRLIIAWLDEGAYGGALPTTVWRGQMTLIRELKLRRYPEGLRVVSEPLDALNVLRNTSYHYENLELNDNTGNFTLGFNGTQLEIIAEFIFPQSNHSLAKEFGVKVFTGHNQSTVIGYDTTQNLLFVDRSESGDTTFVDDFYTLINTTLAPENGAIQLRIFVDSCSVEVFANNGKIAMTNLIFPDPTQDQVQVYAKGGTVTLASVNAWTLNGIWPDNEEGKGIKPNAFMPIFG